MIAMHEENKKSFLDELQSLDEATKRKVAVIATGIFMIGVVYLWFGYFNGLVVGVSQQQATEQATVNSGAGSTTAGKNFLQNIKSDVVGLFSHPGQYNIQPSK